MIGLPLPGKITGTRKCDRCTMRYKVVFSECPHCKDIPDGSKLEAHKREHQESLQANEKMGMIFFAVTALLAAVFILLVLLI